MEKFMPDVMCTEGVQGMQPVILKFWALPRWISCKEINPETIVLHLLVHLVDEVEIAGTVHARWMFFLERFMKTLKGFVRQRAPPEGSMVEGWLVQESCVFVSEYLSRSQNNALELWITKDDDRVVGDVLQGNGVVKQFSEEVRTKVSNYCMMNTDGMQKWYELYEKRRQEPIQACEEWNQANRGVPYPKWLRLLPKSMSASWLQGKIASAKASGELISLDEQEYALGPDKHGGVEEDLPEHAMEEEDEANNFTSGHLHTAMSDVETSMSREETSSDDSSDESGDHESDGNNDDPFNSID
ncbi:hypothetical protein L7F22_035241 [Adiantum nelumboides]|nr:hypothetical protein [Adiantum nelumboides]